MKKSTNHKASKTPSNGENISLEEQIAKRANELWQQRGREDGHDLEDWLQAEREINEAQHHRA